MNQARESHTRHPRPGRLGALDRPALLPYLPLLHAVWSDGALTEAELVGLVRHLDQGSALTPTDRGLLTGWLDPADPLTAGDLTALQGEIRSRWPDGTPLPRSLSELGITLWRAAGTLEGGWDRSEAVAALEALEAELGAVGPDGVRRLLGTTPAASTGASARASARASRPPRSLAPDLLHAFLDRDRLELRREVLSLLGDPALAIPLGLPSDEYRERVLEALRFLADRGLGRRAYPERFGGADDPGGAIAVFESLAFGDLSVLVKFGVQFGLFGGSILQLGTERHHERYLAAVGSLRLPGCYAMTETGHGSNVRDLETTATYDPATDELVVHTPHDGAAKDWIGNAARHGRLAVVFARLLVGGEDHGVHAVLVPVRGDDGAMLPGIRIEDRGLKSGLNGVDNGRIWFDRVRVPRTNLLDRFGQIDPDGRYTSPIASPGRRFFGMLRTLVAGRLSIAAAAVSASKVALTIAVRYTADRRQFGPEGHPEEPILDHPSLRREILPRLATTFALHFATRSLEERYARQAAGPEDPELEVRAAGLKAYASDHCVATVQACREACGGQGYLAENRFAALRADTDVFTTFEGANLVLHQLVAKGLLSRYRDEMGDLSLGRAMRYLMERAETGLVEFNPLVTRRTDPEHLRQPEFHRAAMGYREARLLRAAARRLRDRLEQGMDSFEAVQACQDHLVALSRAHVERFILEDLQQAEAEAPPPLQGSLASLSALFALSRIEADAAWFLDTGYLEGAKFRAIRSETVRLSAELREEAEALVAGFGVPEAVLPPSVRHPRA